MFRNGADHGEICALPLTARKVPSYSRCTKKRTVTTTRTRIAWKAESGGARLAQPAEAVRTAFSREPAMRPSGLIERGFVRGERLKGADGVYFKELKLTPEGEQHRQSRTGKKSRTSKRNCLGLSKSRIKYRKRSPITRRKILPDRIMLIREKMPAGKSRSSPNYTGSNQLLF